MSAEDSDLQESEWQEAIDNKATWQSECGAGVWQYYPELPQEGQEVIILRGKEHTELATLSGNSFTGDIQTYELNEIRAWCYVQPPRKG